MSSLAELTPSRDIKITVYPKNNLIFGLKPDKIIRIITIYQKELIKNL
jgi:hypothetical protein